MVSIYSLHASELVPVICKLAAIAHFYVESRLHNFGLLFILESGIFIILQCIYYLENKYEYIRLLTLSWSCFCSSLWHVYAFFYLKCMWEL